MTEWTVVCMWKKKLRLGILRKCIKRTPLTCSMELREWARQWRFPWCWIMVIDNNGCWSEAILINMDIRSIHIYFARSKVSTIHYSHQSQMALAKARPTTQPITVNLKNMFRPAVAVRLLVWLLYCVRFVMLRLFELALCEVMCILKNRNAHWK